jgi:molybdopterin/thiamine biosynthesis adenylyltransferase
MDLSEELRSARRQLLTIAGFELLEDFAWHSELDSWSLRFSISSDVLPNAYISKTTSWFAVISSSYPWGEIKIYPDQVNGITYTFQHQDYNRPSEKFPWREGDLCVGTSLIKWSRTELVTEPYDALSRLSWYVKRTIEWIEAAASGNLANDGDPFEMPQLPSRCGLTLAFNEDEQTYTAWTEKSLSSSTSTIRSLKNSTGLLAAVHYEIDRDRTIQNEWGTYLKQSFDKEFSGIWILLKQIPVITPWELPGTWGQLFDVLTEQGIDLKALLQRHFLKNKKTFFQFIQLGFPVAEKIGEPETRIHWLCIKINTTKKLKGFRDFRNEIKQSIEILFARKNTIDWLDTANWSREQITGRGTLTDAICDKRFVLIGAGAVGSIFSELLIRLGCKRITVVDQDVLNVGNLSRHTLSMSSVLKPKAQSLAQHLNEVFPFVTATFESQALHRLLKKKPDFFLEYDVVIDATASDEVINLISDRLSGTNKTFLSLSTGIEAKRLFCFINNVENENIERVFREKLSPWLKKEKAENQNKVLPRDGIGCWHPIFPARIDDISMLLDVFVKVFEKIILEENNSRLIIIEKQYNDQNDFIGSNIKYC